MAFAESEKEWAERVARHLKAELKRAGLTYEEPALRLKELGFDETKASITNKLSQAKLSAFFFSQAWRLSVVTVCELKIFRSVNGMPRQTVLLSWLAHWNAKQSEHA